PAKPDAPEWNFAAVGPAKLKYAYAFAEKLVESSCPEAITLYTPGKFYPGEINPRWALWVLHSSSKEPFGVDPNAKDGPPDQKTLKSIREQLLQKLGLDDHWLRAVDPRDRKKQIWVLPLDCQVDKWVSQKWNFRRLDLSEAEGPAGLRLPMHLLAPELTRRGLVLETHADYLTVFLPPLLAGQWENLIQTIVGVVDSRCTVRWEGYVPVDLPSNWSRIGFTADPGVLEV